MSKFVELPVFPPKTQNVAAVDFPVNIDNIWYITESSKDRSKLYFNEEFFLEVDKDIYEMKEIVGIKDDNL